MRKSRTTLAVALIFVLAGASPALPQQDGQQTTEVRYRLAKGDVFDLNFPLVPAFNQTITVQPDGYVTLRGLGTIRVDGMTVPELSDALRTEYSSILRDPVLTVELKDFEKPYFVVVGEVERPGKYDLRGDTTVTQAVAVAGGLRERAKASQAVVVRRGPSGNIETTPIDLKRMLTGAPSNADPRLQPRDMVFVPRGRHVNLSALASSLWVLSLLP